MMRIVFMGTPEFAVPSLEILHQAGYEIAGVFTQPDRPAGRGNKLRASSVKEAAIRLELPIFQPTKIKSAESVEQLRQLQPDCIIVAAFGQILSKEILSIPQFGCINVHASLLPQYRGAAPIHRAVLNGDRITGITTMYMDEGLDTGDIILQTKISIGENDTVGYVHDKLARTGAELLVKTLNMLKDGTMQRTPQPGDFTYAYMLTKEDELLDWNTGAAKIHNQIRGLNPWPGAYTFFRGEKVKVWQSKLVNKSLSDSKKQDIDEVILKDSYEAAVPGTILAITEEGFICNTGKGNVEIIEVQPAGKKKMKARDFANGKRIKPGEIFGEI